MRPLENDFDALRSWFLLVMFWRQDFDPYPTPFVIALWFHAMEPVTGTLTERQAAARLSPRQRALVERVRRQHPLLSLGEALAALDEAGGIIAAHALEDGGSVVAQTAERPPVFARFIIVEGISW